MIELQLPTRLDKIENELTRQFNIQLYLKRDDLIHPEIPGNKWRKLKYNLEEASNQNKKTLVTFGGAYSNHITATAATGKYFGFKTIGIIRGEEYSPLNKSLQFAKDCGMELKYVDRNKFKELRELGFTKSEGFSGANCDLGFDSEEIYILPEGGANEFALNGCKEIVDEIDTDFDCIICPCGTGTTLAGIAFNLKPSQKAIGISVLNHDNFSKEIEEKFKIVIPNSQIPNYALGGYAKTTPELIQFIQDFYRDHQIALDYVYTGKMMYGIFDLMKKNYFPEGSVIIAVHTGGVNNANCLEL